PQVEILSGIIGVKQIVIGDLILTEVLQGFRRNADYQRARDALFTLEYRDMLGRENALAAAQNYRRLRAKGVTVWKTIDVMIATFCITGGYTLLHADRDFDVMRDTLGLLTLDA
ncbi:MAG: VapC toxin family PIN domain ribonuclease, partial [Alphaproteobacteria bacterium]|nr:VapC toxin family PIN domain ribonuclease [Alphaproteobacteria bacterium]